MHFPISCNSDEISVTGGLAAALCGRWLPTGEGTPWGAGFCFAGEQLSQWGFTEDRAALSLSGCIPVGGAVLDGRAVAFWYD